MVAQRLSEEFHCPVRLSEAHWIFPLGVVFKGIDIEGLLRAKQAKVFFNVSNFQKNQIKISRLIVNEGEAEINYNGVKIFLKKIQGDVKNFVYPIETQSPRAFESVKTGIDLKAQVEGKKFPFSGSVASAQGWVDVKSLSMDEHVVLRNFSGKEMLIVDLKARNNDMLVSGNVDMIGMMTQGVASRKKEDSVQNMILGTLNSEGINMMTKFSFQTKMNDFRIGKISFSGNINYVK